MKAKKTITTIKTLATSLAAGTPPPVPADEPMPGWISQVAMLTGALAALTGFLTVRMTTLTNQAIYESNQAILSQTQASDAWSEYQADSIKARIVEIQLLPSSPISPSDKVALTAEDNDLRSRQPQLKQAATSKIGERETHLKRGLKNLDDKDLLGYASMVAQIGIALASAAALVRKRPLFHLAAALGVLGVAITGYVFLIG